MVEQEAIAELADRIAREFKPQRIILFGSYATGTATPDSDVDLLVILPFKGKGLHKSLKILDKVSPRFPVDLIARTPEEVRKRLEWNDFFLREIVERGKVLYDAAHA